MKREFIPLTDKNVVDLIGKTIEWTAEAYKYNRPYEGVFTITGVEMNERTPIKGICISGDSLENAFKDDHGLVYDESINGYKYCNDHICFSYSDLDREVFYRIKDED